ncbi:MAG: caspase family protein [Brumimicrobium sp.]|nr:caspase family protein [Brumimicrobium sp.]
MRKIVLLIHLLTIPFIIFSQDKDYNLRYVDYHSTTITATRLSQDGKYIFTSDEDGKIIQTDAQSYEYVKTIKNPSGVPIANFIQVNDRLMVSEKYEFSTDPSLDSIGMIDIQTGKTIFKVGLSADFIDLNNPNYYAVFSFSGDYFKKAFSFFNLNHEMVKSIQIPRGATHFAVTDNLEKLCMYEDWNKELTIYDLNTNAVLKQSKVSENLSIIASFTDEGEFYVVANNSKNENLEIYNFTNDESLSKVLFSYTDKKDVKYSNKKVVIKKNKGKIYLSLSQGYSSYISVNPLVIVKNKGKFSSFNLLAQSISYSNSEINFERDEIYFVREGQQYGDNRFNDNFSSFDIFSLKGGKFIRNSSSFSGRSEGALFFPDGSWLVSPNGSYNDLTNAHVKFYESGTFNNRFYPLSFRNYLESKFQLKLLSAKLIDDTGIAIIYALQYDDYESKSVFLRYNFMTDEMSEITSNKDAFPKIKVLDYHQENDYLLVSDQEYFNRGYTKSIKIGYYHNSTLTDIPGDYKFAKFSNDGNYLLSIDAKDVLKIRTFPKLKVLFEEELKEGDYEASKIDRSQFIIVNRFREINFKECNWYTWYLEASPDSVSELGKFDCVVINRAAQRGEMVGMIMNEQFVTVGNQKLSFTKSNEPINLSFNSDGSRFMVFFKNGQSVIYDTKTMQPLVTMFHPDESSHVFIDNEGHYFSNFDASELLYVSKNGERISLKDIEQNAFQPLLILEKFGNVNLDYAKTLKKATNYQQTVKTEEDENKEKSPVKGEKSNTFKEDGSSNLYVLGVGVSAYKDKHYTLTFPEKDAYDIARLYGQLSKPQLDDYNDRFYGQTYTLIQNKEQKAKVHKYWGKFSSSFVEVYSLNPEGTQWLFVNDSVYLADFTSQSVKYLPLPLEIEDFYNTGWDKKLNIYPSSNANSFFLRAKDRLYEYNPSKNDFILHSLPSNLNQDFLKPISNNLWASVSINSEENALITISELNGKEETSKEIPLQNLRGEMLKYRTLNERGEWRVNTDYPTFGTENIMDISMDGHYLMMSTYLDGENNLLIYNLQDEDSLPIRIKADISYGDKINFDGNTTNVFAYHFDYENNRIVQSSFNINGESIQPDVSYNMDQLHPQNPRIFLKEYAYIQEKGSDDIRDFGLFDDESLIEKAKPYSFKEVKVQILINEEATLKNIKNQFKTFLSQSKPNDEVILFFAGHGVLDKDNTYYFAPYDMDFGNFKTNGLAFKELITLIQKIPSTHKLVLMDACHSGRTLDIATTTEGEAGTTVNGDARGLVPVKASQPKFKLSSTVSSLFETISSYEGVTFLSAASGGDLAIEHPDWGGGAFTQSYIKTVKDYLLKDENSLFGTSLVLDEESFKQPIVFSNDFLNDLFRKVNELTKGMQEPDIRERDKGVEIRVW